MTRRQTPNLPKTTSLPKTNSSLAVRFRLQPRGFRGLTADNCTLDIGRVMFELPEKVVQLAQAARAQGGRALLVGGCVRDLLMEREPKDWDLEVYCIESRQLRALLDQFGSV